MALVVALAAAGNAATNLLVPAALYVPTALLVALLVVGAALPATRELFAHRRVDEHSVAALLYATLVRIPLGTALLEETLFRGVLLGLGLRRWPRRVAVAWSSALFGLWHVLPSGGLSGYNPVVADLLHGPAGRLVVTTAAV